MAIWPLLNSVSDFPLLRCLETWLIKMCTDHRCRAKQNRTVFRNDQAFNFVLSEIGGDNGMLYIACPSPAHMRKESAALLINLAWCLMSTKWLLFNRNVGVQILPHKDFFRQPAPLHRD
jgi:hypothetical protein